MTLKVFHDIVFAPSKLILQIPKKTSKQYQSSANKGSSIAYFISEYHSAFYILQTSSEL